MTYCSLSPFVEIGLYFIHCTFSLLLWFHMAPSQEPILYLTFEESWWSSEMLWTSPLRWALSSCPLDFSSYWSSPSWSICHPWPTDVSYNTHINMLCPLVIPLILYKMNNTLTVAINPNWILYYTKTLDQSFQSQSFLWWLNCSHVLSLCCWKSNHILQLYLSTNDALIYRERKAHR